MDIILKSDILTITKIKKKSYAKMLKDLVVGDKIQLRVSAKPVGGNRGTYASYIQVVNIKTEEKNEFSFNQIAILYDTFEWE